MRILTKYCLRQHAGPFLFALSALTVLLLLNQVSKWFEKLVGKGLHWSVIAKVFGYSIPFILAQTLPMAVLIAVLFVFNRMAADNEITAMRAGGIPMPRILAPLVLATTLLAGWTVWFNDAVLPESNHKLALLLANIGEKMPTFDLREQTVNEVLPSRVYLQVARIDRQRSALEDVVIYDERLPGRSRTIYADSGTVAFNETQTDLYLNLRNGVVQDEMRNKPQTFQRMFFDHLIMRIKGVSNELKQDSLNGWRSDREMSIGQMKGKVEENRQREADASLESRGYAVGLTRAYLEGTPDDENVTEDSLVDAKAVRATRKERSPWAAASRFHSYATEAQTAEGSANSFRVEIQKKYSLPAACIVFVLIGAPVAIRYPMGGVALVVAVSFVVFAAYYVSLVGGEDLADKLILSPFWAMWGPNVLFGGIGLVMVWRSRRAGH